MNEKLQVIHYWVQATDVLGSVYGPIASDELRAAVQEALSVVSGFVADTDETAFKASARAHWEKATAELEATLNVKFDRLKELIKELPE